MRCKSCFTEKDANAFYASNKTRCKECVKESANAHRQANLESVRAYDRMRGSMPHRVAARSEYQDTTQGRAAHQRALKASNARHPLRYAARVKLRNSVRDGKVTPWPVCAVPECDSRKLEGHHPDYSKPLDVVWLCASHHKLAHTASQEAETT